MSKKLTLTDIKNSNKKFTQKKRVDLSDGSHLFIYPYFSPTSKNELIKEIMTEFTKATELGLDFKKINFADWTAFNLIYKYADLGIPKDIKKKIIAFHELLNYELFGEILASFPKESIDGFNETVLQVQQNLNAILQERGIKLDEALEKATADESDNNIVQ